MVPTFVILILFGASFWLTLTRGIAATFTYVLLPTLLLLHGVDPVEIQKLPDITGSSAVAYGVMLAYMLRGEWRLPVKFGVVDFFVLAMSFVVIVSGMVNDVFYRGVSLTGNQMMEVIVPYFMARITFLDRNWRLQAAKVLVILALPLSFLALIEMRLIPMFFVRGFLAPLQLSSSNYELVLARFGFFRAQVSFYHPIDLGNGGVLVACLIIALACSAGKTLRTPWVLAGVSAGLIMSACSISFTSFLAVGAILSIFWMLRLARYSGWMLVPICALALTFFASMTINFINTPVPEDIYLIDGAVEASMAVRHMIVVNTWEYNQTTGLLGYSNQVTNKDLGLQSVDNAYMLFLLQNGWAYLTMFLAMGFWVAWMAGRALVQIKSGPSRVALAAGVAGIIGTMLGMYTVFFGFVYAKLFLLTLAGTVTLCNMAMSRLKEGRPLSDETADGPVPTGAFT